MTKHWIAPAVSSLQTSREPVPHEINELDWKIGLSANKERLAEHLIAFANNPNGGCLVFGVDDANAELVGVNQTMVEDIISRLTNLGRDAIEPPLVLDHAVVEFEFTSLLFSISENRRISPCIDAARASKTLGYGPAARQEKRLGQKLAH